MKQYGSSDEAPTEEFRRDIDASYLIKKRGRHELLKRVCRITVQPQEYQKILLGNFTADKPPKGYSVEFMPEPYPEDSVVTQITCIGTIKRYRLIMHLANYGNKAVDVEVRQV